jgi:hypothetical protein
MFFKYIDFLDVYCWVGAEKNVAIQIIRDCAEK